jgi:RNA polymerase sigma-70 factor (ECF subfamily)
MESSAPKGSSQDEDRDLVAAVKAGDQKAFELLVKKYMRRAYFVALGLVGNHEDALDISQEAFARCYRALGRFDDRFPFYSWFYTILRNQALSFLRKRKVRRRNFAEMSDEVLEWRTPDEHTPESDLEKKEFRQTVWRAMMDLDPEHREIIVLSHFQNLQYEEIASLLGCPVGTVKSRLYRARAALKERLAAHL